MLQTASPPNADLATSPVEARVAHAADRARIDATEIERLPFDLSVLDSEGVFVNVDARGFGLLDRRLDWQALGITLPRGSGVSFRPPRCGLLPDRYRLPLLRPAAQAHAALHRYSYHFTLTETVFETPAYRWIPWRAFDAFEREFKAAQVALDDARTTALDDYDVLREEVVATFLQLATDSARRLEATGHIIPEGFSDAVVRGVLGVMPGPTDLREKLRLRFCVGVILLGSEMIAEQRKAVVERRNLEEAEADLRFEQQRQAARVRVVQAELWAEEERIQRRFQAEEDERRREAEVKERLRQLKIEAAKERLHDALSPLDEGARQLRAAVYEAAAAIRESLQKHQYLPGASAKRARELARWYRLMNWQSDRQLEALVAELESMASRPGAKRKPEVGPLDQVLGDIIEICYADARALAEPTRMGALEL
ncbi:MAG TPA: hypothetical protein VNF73_15760 [Candidatus Saccharimonadales bacterium]|nr:hypothetical protein [Candidatus Saccharimonadales bacterium]HVC35631.1 hypothetical protein [Chloroflexota bacterium]